MEQVCSFKCKIYECISDTHHKCHKCNIIMCPRHLKYCNECKTDHCFECHTKCVKKYKCNDCYDFYNYVCTKCNLQFCAHHFSKHYLIHL